MDVLTIDSETPDPAMTERALLSQKPGGIVLTYHVGPGQDYQLVKDTSATYADAKATYSTYSYMLAG
jgi:hypothetical protein